MSSSYKKQNTKSKEQWREPTKATAWQAVTSLFLAIVDIDNVEDEEIVRKAYYKDEDGNDAVGVLKWVAGETFKIGNNPQIVEERINEENSFQPFDYSYVFTFLAPDGTFAYSTTNAYFTVDEDDVRFFIVEPANE